MNVFGILTVVALIITAVVLVVGIAGFYRGGAFNDKYGNVLMRARVVSQGVTVVFLVLYLLTRSG
ncbi:MAG: HIG1 domain-containing protein [Pseudomonadota bacterium]